MYQLSDYYEDGPEPPPTPNNRCTMCGGFLRHQPDPSPPARYYRAEWRTDAEGVEHWPVYERVTDPADIQARRYDEVDCAPPSWTCARCGTSHDAAHVWPG